ncbi:MAG: mechanosensitive ion channel family protein [Lachnospiraceae bacterium]
MKRIADRKGIDVSALLYISSIIRFGFRIILVLVLIRFVGVQSNTIAGVFTAISAGLALASQDIVKDFIGGLSIMLTKAFAVDDYIIIVGANVEGYVKKISMFHVIIRGRGDRTITIPCSAVFRASVTNMTAEGNWLMELMVGITYEDNIKVAREVMLAEARKEPLVMQDRPAEVILSELGESSVNLILLAWTTKANHFVAYWRLLENVKLALEANGITIAYNQLDVHLGKLEERDQAAELAEKKWKANTQN